MTVDVASYMMSLNLLTLKKIPGADIIGEEGLGGVLAVCMHGS